MSKVLREPGMQCPRIVFIRQTLRITQRGIMPIIGLDHVQVAAPRVDGVEARARAFYGGILGMEEIEKPDALKANGGVWFSTGAGQLHIGLEEPFYPARKAHPAFSVRDLPGLRRRLEANSIPVFEAEPIPGIERFYVYDPFGNRIELLMQIG